MQFESDALRVTLTEEGGHIAEIFDKAAGVSPLWLPPWPSIEPSSYAAEAHPEYGLDSESKLLSGIMGHNLCLDFFGPPSEAEAQSGLTVHGEGSTALYNFRSAGNEVEATASLRAAQLSFTRQLRLEGRRLVVRETVENLSAYDRPIAWQQHVTLGPPFLVKGETQLRAPVAKAALQNTEQEFEWPLKPDGDGKRDLRLYTAAPSSGGYTAQLLHRANERSWFCVFAPHCQLVLAYVWQTGQFPWLGMWEENYSRQQPPWNGETSTLGLEFGTAPFPETRRQMIDRGSFFETPSYQWIEARAKITADYYAALLPVKAIPETLEELEALLSNY